MPVRCLWLLVLIFAVPGAFAQDPEPKVEPDTPIAVEQQETVSDDEIVARIQAVFDEIESLESVTVSAKAGVVRLAGTTVDLAAAKRAAQLAARVDGVVTIENDIERDASVERRLAPAFQQMSNLLEEIIRFSPLIAIALVSFLILMFIGSRFSRWQWFWERVTPNAFIAELLSTTARILFIGLGIVTALSILDATAFLGTFLGAAGVLGLAVGFAVRDTIENYIASIMLSLRQPFAPNDFVVIDGKEGRVVRLTSRATILMTMDGNHLRIPNAQVFKAVILNYTRNPLRRFDFELGVDANDDPIAAIDLGLGVLSKLDFVLADPGPGAWIKQVGDSNIVLFFCAWIDQREASFAKARSAAITAVKSALEAGGFSLPEPIYKLRFDGPPPTAEEAAGAAAPKPQPPPPRTPLETPVVDVTPKDDIERQVEEERRAEDGDLLDTTAKRE